MTNKQAKIIALETIASSVNLILNEVYFSKDCHGNRVRSHDDVNKIISQMDKIAANLNKQANRLKIIKPMKATVFTLILILLASCTTQKQVPVEPTPTIEVYEIYYSQVKN